jgi:transposase
LTCEDRLAGEEPGIPKTFPEQFCRDVVAMARRGDVPKRKVAEDFGIFESCLHRWIKDADVERVSKTA